MYRVIMSFLFKVWGTFLPTDDKLVIFVSFMGMGFNDSPKAIYDYMQSHPEYKGYRCVWAFEHPENFPDLETVKIDTPAFLLDKTRLNRWPRSECVSIFLEETGIQELMKAMF